jgi:hypothetical protein
MTSPRQLTQDTSLGLSSKELTREHTATSDDEDDEDRSQPRMVRIANSSLLLLEDYSSSTASMLRGGCGFFPEEHLLDRVVCIHIPSAVVIGAVFLRVPCPADIFFLVGLPRARLQTTLWNCRSFRLSGTMESVACSWGAVGTASEGISRCTGAVPGQLGEHPSVWLDSVATKVCYLAT